MSFGHIVDQLHDEHSFSNTCTTKQPDLSTSLVGCQEVNDLHGNGIYIRNEHINNATCQTEMVY
jgi:hypothetical protein